MTCTKSATSHYCSTNANSLVQLYCTASNKNLAVLCISNITGFYMVTAIYTTCSVNYKRVYIAYLGQSRCIDTNCSSINSPLCSG